jgi:peptidoglycan hydrolase-like protein with peptidoglycan-binding domain
MIKSSSYRPQCYRGSHSMTEEPEQEPAFFSKNGKEKQGQEKTAPFFQSKPLATYASDAEGEAFSDQAEQPEMILQDEMGQPGNTTGQPQPTTGNNEGDLNNPRFKGDPQLEACLDHQRLFSTGSSGDAVAKIQSGMSDYFTHKGEPDPLPQFGADGQFGSETRRAVIGFQEDVGFVGNEVDGVIGHNTMNKLDKEVPVQEPPKVDPPKKDPDEDCMGCKPISKITKTNKDKSTTTFGICDDNFDVLNTGAGTATVGPGCLAQTSNKKGRVNFSAGASGKPAWQETADLHDCTTPPPKANAKPEWEVGFIQTLESSTFGAAYENSNFVSVTNKDARDALGASVAAPWYDTKGNTLGPQEYPTVPMINDTPNVTFSIAHPDTGKDFLKSVCMKANFNIWLIINKIGVTPIETNVDFLHHWSININQNYLLNGEGAHPCNQSAWMALGRQTMNNKGPGKGAAKLVWDKPVAKGNEVTDTALKADPCNAPAPQKDPAKNLVL